MHDAPSLDELWRTAPAPHALFDVARIAHLPLGARRYLTHAIVPGTPLANAVRLRMHGEIKLRGWYPFAAEQVIRWDRGMIWRSTARVRCAGDRSASSPSSRPRAPTSRARRRGAPMSNRYGCRPSCAPTT